ncbi:hypothetical protein J6590_072823 [Homalodisca vitripennis]|nr:hypothetical protein J6590_072823 [Homalodisca vitripennis]
MAECGEWLSPGGSSQAYRATTKVAQWPKLSHCGEVADDSDIVWLMAEQIYKLPTVIPTQCTDQSDVMYAMTLSKPHKCFGSLIAVWPVASESDIM